jgi:coenzyme F420-reducing hydrogenase alpha subunit
MARDHADIVQRGLDLKRTGNEIIELVGGRAVHPVNVRVGGFYRVPTRAELRPLVDRLERAREAASETVRWVAGFDFPDFEQDYEFVALSHPNEYPFNDGRLVSNKGLDIAVREYDDSFVEEHVAHSTALHSSITGRGSYFCGPLARYHLNFERLSPSAQQAARGAGLGPSCRNPFQSIIVRAVEVLYACDEALRLVEAYEPPDSPAMEIEARAGTGYACTEAPRGSLYHRYRIDHNGIIQDAKIVPPTSQNQGAMEADLRRFVSERIDLPKKELTWQCEQAIRNYDPCISCSTHFLTLDLEEEA